MKKGLVIVSLTLCAFVFQSEELPRINGVVETKEWNGAITHELRGGNSIMLLHKGDQLYVALVSQSSFWAHLYLSDGKTIMVMHISAALDDVTYNKGNSSWTTSDKFEYEMRDRVFNDETHKKMNAYFDSHRWVANNVNMGDGKVVEAKIDLGTSKEPLYFTGVIATASGSNINTMPFPTTVADDAILPRLVQGYTPDSLNFKPETWFRLR